MNEPQIEEQITEKKNSSPFPISILIAALIIAFAWIYTKGFMTTQFQKSATITQNAGERSNETAAQAIELPAAWGNLGAQMVAAGVIDRAQLETLYAQRGGFTDGEKQLLEGDSGKIMVTQENSSFILNLLWALGLSNKNKILEEGPMADPQYGGAGKFASTGGWTIAKGSAMDHYSKHSFIALTPEQQALVEKVSKNIYRPCCNNSTYFPDCNHGMAMLGLLELLASQGVRENQMYETALQINTLWFPEQYATIARYFESKGQALSAISPKEILGVNYSSASGYQKIESLLPRKQNQNGGSCGI
jgi:hypothetical protein